MPQTCDARMCCCTAVDGTRTAIGCMAYLICFVDIKESNQSDPNAVQYAVTGKILMCEFMASDRAVDDFSSFCIVPLLTSVNCLVLDYLF